MDLQDKVALGAAMFGTPSVNTGASTMLAEVVSDAKDGEVAVWMRDEEGNEQKVEIPCDGDLREGDVATVIVQDGRATAISAGGAGERSKAETEAAQQAATDAQTDATQAKTDAADAKETAADATQAASDAQSAADTAKSAADAATSAATDASTKADAAASAAETAGNKADAAQTTANTAQQAATDAQTDATQAKSDATAAKTTAETAQTTAQTASDTAAAAQIAVAATKQHFWADDEGAHVATTAHEEGATIEGSNLLATSDGIQIRDGETTLAEFNDSGAKFNQGGLLLSSGTVVYDDESWTAEQIESTSGLGLAITAPNYMTIAANDIWLGHSSAKVHVGTKAAKVNIGINPFGDTPVDCEIKVGETNVRRTCTLYLDADSVTIGTPGSSKLTRAIELGVAEGQDENNPNRNIDEGGEINIGASGGRIQIGGAHYSSGDEGIMGNYGTVTLGDYGHYQAGISSVDWNVPVYAYRADTSRDTLPLLAYPVGSIYMSVNSTSPAELFGGTWEEIAGGRVLMGQSDDYAAGTTGGSATHTHTGPAHTHAYGARFGSYYGSIGTSDTSGGSFELWNGSASAWVTSKYGSTSTGTSKVNTGLAASSASKTVSRPYLTTNTSSSGTGKTGSASSLPPYLAVYMWKRTA
jgi:hypothetical protein